MPTLSRTTASSEKKVVEYDGLIHLSFISSDFLRDDMRKFLMDALFKLSRTNLRDPSYVGMDLTQRF